MTLLQAIILGVLQGVTEFLPVSSSAHLALAPVLFGWEQDHFSLSFDVALHVGTLVAVLWYFRRDWMNLAVAAVAVARSRTVTTTDERRCLYLGIALIPALVAGLLLNDLAETTFRDPRITAGALIVMGVILWLVDRWAPMTRHLDGMRWKDALFIGVAQVLALIPGVSRSGATMTAGRMLALDRQSAARFSFLMSMPVIAAAAVLKVPDVLRSDGITSQLMAGTVASAITGWLAIGFLLRFLALRGFAVFAVYRILLGVAVYAFLFLNRG